MFMRTLTVAMFLVAAIAVGVEVFILTEWFGPVGMELRSERERFAMSDPASSAVRAPCCGATNART
jgi:hypothetical protein